jgi:hypothetical protein
VLLSRFFVVFSGEYLTFPIIFITELEALRMPLKAQATAKNAANTWL